MIITAFGFHKLATWQQAHAFTLLIYKVTNTFPREERYGITDQLRRAASSIGAQIAEGSRMETQMHRKLYYNRAYASAAEVANFLHLAHDLGHLSGTDYEALLKKLHFISVMIYRLAQSCSDKRIHM